jgi:hypothetical protein
MRKILFAAATALLCQAAYAEDAVAPTPPAPAVAAAAPAAAAAPDAGAKTAAKPAKKKAARGGGRNWQSDEARARSIASKYGVSW